MPVTDRPLQPSPWAQVQADKRGIGALSERTTNRLIALAFGVMVAISTIYLMVDGVN